MPTSSAQSMEFCCAGSASVAAIFDVFITETEKHPFLKLFLRCHRTFTPER
ncbi:hypothetical protein [Leptospira interrogans]|uniref:hypothetical protein n=1 Tax=Leptospira interrogans TaxID=173 RepID=UPI001C683EED|nr:hypothetical protein [Leptospira interrogans]